LAEDIKFVLKQNYQYKLELEYQSRQADKLIDKIKKLQKEKVRLKVDVENHAKMEKQLGLQFYYKQKIFENVNDEKNQVEFIRNRKSWIN
jgi:hypothetical protein